MHKSALKICPQKLEYWPTHQKINICQTYFEKYAIFNQLKKNSKLRKFLSTMFWSNQKCSLSVFQRLCIGKHSWRVMHHKAQLHMGYLVMRILHSPPSPNRHIVNLYLNSLRFLYLGSCFQRNYFAVSIKRGKNATIQIYVNQSVG